jgi:hypothetical protein
MCVNKQCVIRGWDVFILSLASLEDGVGEEEDGHRPT